MEAIYEDPTARDDLAVGRGQMLAGVLLTGIGGYFAWQEESYLPLFLGVPAIIAFICGMGLAGHAAKFLRSGGTLNH